MFCSLQTNISNIRILIGFTTNSNASQQMTEIKEKAAQIQTSLLKASGKSAFNIY